MRSAILKSMLCLTLLGMVVFVVAPVVAQGPSDEAGQSTTAHLYLIEKDPNTWSAVWGGAWGKLKYNTTGTTFDYVFTGHGLEGGVDYALIYYPDPWPGENLIVLGGPAAANNGGNLNLQGSVDTGDLPAPYDDNSDPCTADGGMVGAKIWLVLADDIAITNKMVGWNPGEYLFEWDRIIFDDTDE